MTGSNFCNLNAIVIKPRPSKLQKLDHWENYELISSVFLRKAKDEFVKMKKERDFHRMHHHRVAQEKNKLITDLKRVKSHYETYEPVLKTMKDKYEGAVRDKVVNQLEKERAVAELKAIKQNEFSNGTSKFDNQFHFIWKLRRLYLNKVLVFKIFN